MMKRIMPLFLAVVLVLTAVGCSGHTPETAPTAQPTLPTLTPDGTEQTADGTAERSAQTEQTPPETAQTATEPAPAGQTQPAAETTEPAPAKTEPAPVTTEPAPATTAEPVEPSALVRESFFDQGVFTDKEGQNWTYSYDLPNILANTPGAQEINAAIEARFGYDLKRTYEEMDAGLPPTDLLSLGFYTETCGDVLTVVIVAHPSWDFEDYAVYPYDMRTGAYLTTADLLERMDVTQEEFLETCRRQFRQYFVDLYHEIPADRREECGYNRALDEVDSDFYVNMDLMAYPEANGDIVVIAPIVSLAGPDFFYYPIHLGLGGVG